MKNTSVEIRNHNKQSEERQRHAIFTIKGRAIALQ